MTTVVQPRAGEGERPRSGAWASLRSLVRGNAADAAWARPAFIGVTLLAAVLYFWGLTISGYANTYYSAAALAGSQSWSAWFFGSVDASNFITVDKPPLAIMLMGLSVRLFGLNSFAILLPEALIGVASVALLWVVVRRTFGPAAALIAALVMAFSPVAVLIFRYNNPDALLTLLLIAGAWAIQRAITDRRFRWLVLAGLFVGLGFNTKFLQAYLVLPAFVVAYVIAGVGGLRHRIGGFFVLAASTFVASGWWVATLQLLPASMRPFVGGSTDGTPLQLLLGYDGLGRIFGQGGGAPGGGGGGGFSGAVGLLRLFNAEFGGQISWLIPLALVGLAAGLWIHRHAPRIDPKRAAYLLWGGWFLVTALVFSYMSGIIHSYYAVALAPAIGVLVGAGVVDLWRARSHSIVAGFVLAAGVLVTAIWCAVLLNRTPTFLPGADVVIVMAALAGAIVIAMPEARHFPRLSMVAATVALVALMIGPAAYAASTIGTAYSGGDPSAGPSSGQGGFGGQAGGPGGAGGGAPTGGGPAAGFGGGAGGGGGGGATSQAVLDYLVANRGTASWIVAISSANQAGSIELATGEPVMAMGGFSGSDPTPTLAQFQALVASGQLRFAILNGGGGGGPGGRSGTASEVSTWVSQNCTAVTIDGTTIYDCSTATTS